MKACNVMAALHDAGLVLALNRAGCLAVSPASRITPALRIVIKANRDCLLAQLSQEANNDGGPQFHNHDRWCWPYSAAMNGQEVDTFMARLARFTDRGISLAEAEIAADLLVIRDREGDDRALCLECTRLQGAGRWRCENWTAADVPRERLAHELVTMLQRCSGLRLPADGRVDGQSTQGS